MDETEGQQGIEQLLAELEHSRRLLIINLFTQLGVVFLFLFGSYSGYQGYWDITSVTYSMGVILIIAQQYAKRTRIDHVSQHLFVFVVLVLYAFLLIKGGVNNTGPLWCYPLLLLIVFIYGYPLGNYVAVSLIVFSVVFLFFIDPLLNDIYQSDFRIRFIASLSGLFLVARFGQNAQLLTQSKMYQFSQEFYHASMHDPLTDLLNRRAIIELMNYEYKRTLRNDTSFSIIMIDIDHFKLVNDNNGHDCGDHVIKSVAKHIRAQLREHDQVSRWGGEEFLILIPDTPIDQAPTIAEKIRAQVAKNVVTYKQNEIKVTISIGVASYSSGDDLDRVIKRADERLYKAKRQGRNCVV
jgi:diguanylate cyclase (GGDEF)-like protein